MQEKIRILHVLGALNRGGAETMVMNLYRNIDRSKKQFDFVIHTTDKCDYEDEIQALGGKIYHLPSYNGRNHFKYKKAWNQFFLQHPDYNIIHGHMRSTAAIYLKIAKKYGIKTIAHSHSTSSGAGLKARVKDVMQLPIRHIADYLFACSKEAGKWLFGRKFVKKDNFKIVKNAIDAKTYSFNDETREKMRSHLGIKQNQYVIGHVGRFSFPKNHDFLIRIFLEVKKKEENAILLLIGDGELKCEIEKNINDFGLKENVILAGNVPNVNDYMQAMDIFVFPSLYEGLGIVVVEAQAAGLHCVVADTIPKEAFISDLISVTSLNKDTKDWANIIIQNNGLIRRNTYDEIKVGAFDILDQVKYIESFYEMIIN